MLKISGECTQIRSGKIVHYTVEYELPDGETTGSWSGEVLLRKAKRHQLAGGVLTNVKRDTIAPAVIQALHAELETLDFEALNAQHGN